MPIDPNSNPKDYKDILYNKTEINAQQSAEAVRVDAALDTKVDKQQLGSPVGVATLNVVGKVSYAEMPYSGLIDSGDDTNDNSAMTPQRTLYQIAQKSVPVTDVGIANGICALDVDALVPVVNLPPQPPVRTIVVATLAELYAETNILEGDRGVVTAEADPADNGEYVANKDIPVAPSSAADWDLLPNLSAVQSVNGETGDITIDKSNTPDIATNEADIITNGVAITANDQRMTDERTFRDETGIDVDTIIGLGEHAVTDNLPLNAEGVQYVEGIITVYGDDRTIADGNGFVQLFWNGAIVTDGSLDGAYIARATVDSGTTWSAWEVEPVYTDADYFDFTPQTPPLNHKEGRFFYDDTSKTHVGYTDIIGVSRNYGEQFDVRVHNATGTQLLNGRAIKGSNSSTAGFPNAVYSNTTTFANARVVGVITSTISNGNGGYGTIVGSVGVDTTDGTLFDWVPAVGDNVYLNDAGTYSNARAAIFSYIGQITVIGTAGKMLVQPTTVVDNPQYGGFINKSISQSIGVSSTPVAIQAYDSQENEGITLDPTVGTLSPNFDGLYTFVVTLHGKADSNNQILNAQIWDLTNTAEVTSQILSTNLGTNNGGAISFTFEARVVTGTEYIVRIYTDGSTFNFTLNQCQFSFKSTKIETGF